MVLPRRQPSLCCSSLRSGAGPSAEVETALRTARGDERELMEVSIGKYRLYI